MGIFYFDSFIPPYLITTLGGELPTTYFSAEITKTL